MKIDDYVNLIYAGRESSAHGENVSKSEDGGNLYNSLLTRSLLHVSGAVVIFPGVLGFHFLSLRTFAKRKTTLLPSYSHFMFALHDSKYFKLDAKKRNMTM